MLKRPVLLIGMALVLALALVIGFQVRSASADFDGNACPGGQGAGTPVSNRVGAHATLAGNNVTYFFDAFYAEGSGGAPGLVEYCVYVDTLPTLVETVATGANGAMWSDPWGADSFSWSRPDGTVSNIPYDGAAHEMGTAWFASVPAEYTNIVLHIDDMEECQRIYGSGSSNTCFVRPGEYQPVVDLKIDKSVEATYDTTWAWDLDKQLDDEQPAEIQIPEGESATFDYVVSVTHDDGTDGNFAVGGTITVTNDNLFEMDAHVEDVVDNGGDCGGPWEITVPADDSVDIEYACTYDPDPDPTVEGKNTATVTWDKTLYGTPGDSAYIEKPFTFKQNLVDDCVDASDTLYGDLGEICYTDPSPTEFNYSVTFSDDPAGTCTDHQNVADITGEAGVLAQDDETVTVCVGADLDVSKTAVATYDTTYTWDIDKNADETKFFFPDGDKALVNYTVDLSHDAGVDGNWLVKGVITITNPNDWQDIVVTDVDDTVDNGGLCTVDVTLPFNLAKSSSVDLDYECTYAAGPVEDGNNTVEIAWDQTSCVTPNGTDSETVPFEFVQNEVDECVTVSDPIDPNSPHEFCVGDTELSFSYSAEYLGVGGTCTDYDNKATFVTNDTKTEGDDEETVTVCVGLDLTVEKTAEANYTREYFWDISKDVDPQIIKQVGGMATFDYTVNVWQTGFTDSDWAVTGVITITNPNDWEDIDVDTVVDMIGLDECVVDATLPVTIPMGDSVDLDYACEYAEKPEDGTNTVTITWDNAKFFTPTGEASAEADFAFGDPTDPVNKCVNVTDTFNGGDPVDLGEICATDVEPYASAEYKYERLIAVPRYDCVDYTNVAEIVETEQSDTETVTVCGPIYSGARTIGFWHNKNGQNLIKNSPTIGTTCVLGTWLDQFAPLAGAPNNGCGGIATWVYNVIEAANAGNAGMKAMLKAQMLATALDVYFSDPALGGNMLNAPAPIGGLLVDLTAIKGYKDVSAAFGGATSMTVMQMLQYASSQYVGTTWYGGVKSLQGLAKDAFDAINNQWVFAP